MFLNYTHCRYEKKRFAEPFETSPTSWNFLNIPTSKTDGYRKWVGL
jgi:hypothetical protein